MTNQKKEELKKIRSDLKLISLYAGVLSMDDDTSDPQEIVLLLDYVISKFNDIRLHYLPKAFDEMETKMETRKFEQSQSILDTLTNLYKSNRAIGNKKIEKVIDTLKVEYETLTKEN